MYTYIRRHMYVGIEAVIAADVGRVVMDTNGSHFSGLWCLLSKHKGSSGIIWDWKWTFKRFEMDSGLQCPFDSKIFIVTIIAGCICSTAGHIHPPPEHEGFARSSHAKAPIYYFYVPADSKPVKFKFNFTHDFQKIYEVKSES